MEKNFKRTLFKSDEFFYETKLMLRRFGFNEPSSGL